MFEKIETWDDIIENLEQFKQIVENRNNITYNRFAQFSLWYYFPKEKSFAPNKFLLNKNTTLDNYNGEGFSANRDNVILSKYFNEVPKNSEEFNKLFIDLEAFAFEIGAILSIAIKDGNGGIFLPKEKYTYNENNDEDENFYNEGKAEKTYVNKYERNKKARQKCIEHYGCKCFTCNLLLSDIYGAIADDFIHVHHIKELSLIREEYTVSPIEDLRPLCPNCHAIIHRKSPSLTIEELKEIINNKLS